MVSARGGVTDIIQAALYAVSYDPRFLTPEELQRARAADIRASKGRSPSPAIAIARQAPGIVNKGREWRQGYLLRQWRSAQLALHSSSFPALDFRYSLVAYASSDAGSGATASAPAVLREDTVTVAGSPAFRGAAPSTPAGATEPLVLEYVVIITDQRNLFPIIAANRAGGAAGAALGADPRGRTASTAGGVRQGAAPIEEVLAAAHARCETG